MTRLILTCALLLAVPPVLARGPSDEAAAIARELMSPYCPGLLLADCQSSGARDLRGEIRSRLDAGETSRDIVDDLAARYGTGILGQPAMEGFGILAWVLPPVLGIASLFLLTWWLRISASPVRVPDRPGSIASDDDRMRARVDQELLALD